MNDTSDTPAPSPEASPGKKDDASSAREGATPEDGAPPGSPEGMGAIQVTAGVAHGRYIAHVLCGVLPVTGTATATTSDFGKDDTVILRTNRGTELGIALTGPEPAGGEVGETVGHVLRKATSRDLAEQRRIEDELQPDESRFCKKKISERSLRMRLSSVEHIFGGERVVFYFTAERRVDFRALVRDLAWHFHTRIELRQIGARDEARLLADFEHCGRPLCCKVFLRNLEPVTMRMAKLQRTTLDPQKISGRCGRLMCCLRFEDQVYRELRKGLPHKGTRVRVGEQGQGREGEVVSTDILTQRATVRLGDGELVRVPVTDLRPPTDGGVRTDPKGAPSADGAKRADAAAGRRASTPRGERKGGRGDRRGRRQKTGREDASGGPKDPRQQKPGGTSKRAARKQQAGQAGSQAQAAKGKAAGPSAGDTSAGDTSAGDTAAGGPSAGDTADAAAGGAEKSRPDQTDRPGRVDDGVDRTTRPERPEREGRKRPQGRRRRRPRGRAASGGPDAAGPRPKPSARTRPARPEKPDRPKGAEGS